EDLPLAEAVLNETLRKKPPFPVLNRKVEFLNAEEKEKDPKEPKEEPREIAITMPNGHVYHFAKNDMVSILLTTMHTDPQYWGKDAAQFNPQRFINGVEGLT